MVGDIRPVQLTSQKNYIFLRLNGVKFPIDLLVQAYGVASVIISLEVCGGKFDRGPTPLDIVSLYTELGVEGVTAQTTGEDTYVIRSSPLEDDVRAGLVDAWQRDLTVK
jgi:hypothetical protein